MGVLEFVEPFLFGDQPTAFGPLSDGCGVGGCADGFECVAYFGEGHQSVTQLLVEPLLLFRLGDGCAALVTGGCCRPWFECEFAGAFCGWAWADVAGWFGPGQCATDLRVVLFGVVAEANRHCLIVGVSGEVAVASRYLAEQSWHGRCGGLPVGFAYEYLCVEAGGGFDLVQQVADVGVDGQGRFFRAGGGRVVAGVACGLQAVLERAPVVADVEELVACCECGEVVDGHAVSLVCCMKRDRVGRSCV